MILSKNYAGVFVTLLVVTAVCVESRAALTIVSAIGGQPASGVNYINFNGDPSELTQPGGLGSGVSLVLTPDAALVTGSVTGQYAAPWISNGNGAFFGDPMESGANSTQYVTSGSNTGINPNAAAALVFDESQKYIGLLWGSVDLYNTLSFYDGNTLLGVITGGDINPTATGDQGVNGTFYVNINSDVGFNRVVATSSQYAFEFDNVAFGTEQLVIPEAATIVVWSILGLIGMVAYRKRRNCN